MHNGLRHGTDFKRVLYHDNYITVELHFDRNLFTLGCPFNRIIIYTSK